MSFNTLLFERELPYHESEPCGEMLRVCGESPPSARANASVPRTYVLMWLAEHGYNVRQHGYTG